MTIGQRIAQKRKELGLSQESLGNQLGVSRQSIYKWEADSALPEVDKLIALSRLFGVSVGWLLGVETPADTEPSPEGAGSGAPAGELTEAQLKMVEEITERYLASQPKPKRRRWPFVLAGIVLAVVFTNLFQSLDTLRLTQESIFNEISRVEDSVDHQIDDISGRVEEILQSQNSLTADCGAALELVSLRKGEAGIAVFSAYAVPKTYQAGMAAEFTIENGTGGVQTVPGQFREATQTFSADSISCRLTDDIRISVVFTGPDGTRSTQLLDQYAGLYSQTLPAVELMNYGSGPLLGLEANSAGLLTLPEVYVTVSAPRASSPVSSPVFSVNGEPLPQAEAQAVQVGLFKNNALIAWLEPCQQPETFHGDYTGQQFFRLPAGVQTTLTRSTDQLAFAAVVTDEYGREAVSSDIPYALEDGALSYASGAIIGTTDPAGWQYSG